ncbi:MAG: CofD-related protein of GAK system [Parasphingorhabdus sp.]
MIARPQHDDSALLAGKPLADDKGLGNFAPLFFSGGSALNDLSLVIKKHTRRSIHLITPFDSGGSSASLRDAFNMPAVGDLRNRMIALADDAHADIRSVTHLLSKRLPNHGSASSFKKTLDSITQSTDPEMADIARESAEFIQLSLEEFLRQSPVGFDFSGASIGNLILCGDYLLNGRSLRTAVAHFGQVARVSGVVQPMVEENLHLSAVLSGGGILTGQHRLTGKQVPPITHAISGLRLSRSAGTFDYASCQIDASTTALIASADLICFPPGSFFTSLCANLLPGGVTEAVVGNPCNKVFVPNLGHDPEQRDYEITDLIEFLLGILNAHRPGQGWVNPPLTHILMHHDESRYSGSVDQNLLESYGIQLVKRPLVHRHQAYYDAELLFEELSQIAGRSDR